MRIIEWLAVAAFVVYGIKTFQTQEYWLDRQIVKAVKWFVSLFRSK